MNVSSQEGMGIKLLFRLQLLMIYRIIKQAEIQVCVGYIMTFVQLQCLIKKRAIV